MRGDGYRPAHRAIPPRNRPITGPFTPFPCQPAESPSGRMISAAAALSPDGGFPPRGQRGSGQRGGSRPAEQSQGHCERLPRPVQAPSARWCELRHHRHRAAELAARGTALAPPGGRPAARVRGRRPCRRAAGDRACRRAPHPRPEEEPRRVRGVRLHQALHLTAALRDEAPRRDGRREVPVDPERVSLHSMRVAHRTREQGPARLPGGRGEDPAGRGCGHGVSYSSEDPSTPRRPENQPRSMRS